MPDVNALANGNVLVSIPIILRESAGRKRIITDEKNSKLMKILLFSISLVGFTGRK